MKDVDEFKSLADENYTVLPSQNKRINPLNRTMPVAEKCEAEADDRESDEEQVPNNEFDDQAEEEGQLQMAGVVDHAGNMKEFINFYGISVDFPAMFIQYAKFYPLDPRYSI